MILVANMSHHQEEMKFELKIKKVQCKKPHKIVNTIVIPQYLTTHCLYTEHFMDGKLDS